MPETTDEGEYHVDHHGVNGWRVWWLDDEGRTRQIEMKSEEAAREWAEYAVSLLHEPEESQTDPT